MITSMVQRRRRVVVTEKSASGRAIRFQDTRTGREMTRAQFVREIEAGKYSSFHVRRVSGVKTPAADPSYRAKKIVRKKARSNGGTGSTGARRKN